MRSFPLCFKTRRLQIEFNNKTQKGEKYDLKGFLIEDDDKLAKGLTENINRKIHPLAINFSIRLTYLLQLYDWKY